MASSNAITVEDTVMAILEANLDANQSFTDADLGVTASEILYLRGERYNVTKTPAILVSCNRWEIDGNPNVMGGSRDRGVAQITGFVEFADRDDQEETIRYFAWAVKEVLEGQGTHITDTTTGKEIYGEVRLIEFVNLLAMELTEGGDHRMFRAFTVRYGFMIPLNV
jgi:hypothetical protein